MNTKIINNDNDEVLFDYIDENGVVKKAEIISLFTLEENKDKKYAICSIPTDDDNFDITAFIVNDLGNNTISLDDIIDEEEFDKVSKVVNEIME